MSDIAVNLPIEPLDLIKYHNNWVIPSDRLIGSYKLYSEDVKLAVDDDEYHVYPALLERPLVVPWLLKFEKGTVEASSSLSLTEYGKQYYTIYISMLETLSFQDMNPKERHNVVVSKLSPSSEGLYNIGLTYMLLYWLTEFQSPHPFPFKGKFTLRVRPEYYNFVLEIVISSNVMNKFAVFWPLVFYDSLFSSLDLDSKNLIIPQLKTILPTIGNGLMIKKSTIPGAGNGLFATKPFSEGSIVTWYGGTIMSHSDAKKLKISETSHLRALYLMTWVMRGDQLENGQIVTSNDTKLLEGTPGGQWCNSGLIDSDNNLVFEFLSSSQIHS